MPEDNDTCHGRWALTGHDSSCLTDSSLVFLLLRILYHLLLCTLTIVFFDLYFPFTFYPPTCLYFLYPFLFIIYYCEGLHLILLFHPPPLYVLNVPLRLLYLILLLTRLLLLLFLSTMPLSLLYASFYLLSSCLLSNFYFPYYFSAPFLL